MDFEPLNGALYRALMARFHGHVKVANRGEAQIGEYKADFFDKETMKLDLTQPGEYYMVNCPYCNDTKFRLYINHRWGVIDTRPYAGRNNRNLWLAICYNEKCLQTHERRLEFYEDEIKALPGELGKARILKGKEVKLEDVKMEWPGHTTRVDLLPDGHHAKHYLISRNFDPERIGKFYNVQYCADSFRWLARDRIIIPIYEGKDLKGWQARYIGEINWKKEGAPPKYYTAPGTPRRLLIYNLASAAQYRTGVIVEGPTDVWSFGPMSCCTLGATMTAQQQRRFLSRFKEHSAILLYDPEEYERDATKKLVSNFSGQFAKGFASVKLPSGRDPGDLNRSFMRDYVYEKAKEQGVIVSWRMR